MTQENPEPPDLQQAIHAATAALDHKAFDPALFIGHSLRDAARVAVEAAWPVMAVQLQAAQAEIDDLAICQHELRQAKEQIRRLQDENERVRHELGESNARRELLRTGTEQELQVTLEQLQTAQAEVRELTRQVSWMRTALLHADPRHEEAIREALNQQATPGQDDDGIYCTACNRTLTPGPPDDGHDPQCGFLADARAALGQVDQP